MTKPKLNTEISNVRKDMAKITLWDKVLDKVTGKYSAKTRNLIVAEETAARRKAAELELLARQREIAESIAKAEAEKAKAKAEEKIAEVKAAAKPQTEKKPAAKKVARDGDGDGKINDGTKNEKPAPKKATPKKQAELKSKPAPAPNKKSK